MKKTLRSIICAVLALALLAGTSLTAFAAEQFTARFYLHVEQCRSISPRFEPIENATITLNGQTNVTDDFGETYIVVTTAGTFDVTITLPEGWILAPNQPDPISLTWDGTANHISHTTILVVPVDAPEDIIPYARYVIIPFGLDCGDLLEGVTFAWYRDGVLLDGAGETNGSASWLYTTIPGTYQARFVSSLTGHTTSTELFEGFFHFSGERVMHDGVNWPMTCPVDHATPEPPVENTDPPAIPNNHSSWAAPELQRAAEQNLIPVTLQPAYVDLTQPITRAEFAGIVVLAFESLARIPALPTIVNPFTDTHDSYVLRAFNTGLMVGISDTQFDPNTPLNREQTATALTRAFKRATIPTWTFATDANYPLNFDWPVLFEDDKNISDWARESVYFMAANGIILGTGNNMFSPRAATSEQQAMDYAIATREQALIIALRMVENLRQTLD